MASPSLETASFAVVGAGAVGSYFGGMLARAGVPVTLIGRPGHVQAISEHGLLLDTAKFQERVRVAAETDIQAVSGAEIVLVCVKTVDTEDVAKAIAPHIVPDAVVLSLQNGVDNAERMYRAAGIDALPAVVYVAVNIPAPGHVRHSARGDLVVGERGSVLAPGSTRAQVLQKVANRFVAAEIPCRVSTDIRPELWTKLVMNCAYNAISALGESKYGRMVASAEVRELMTRIVDETFAVARASGVKLDEQKVLEATIELGRTMHQATSSMAQDLQRGRRTEIDSLNGLIAREGTRLGVPAPVNQALATLIRIRESLLR